MATAYIVERNGQERRVSVISDNGSEVVVEIDGERLALSVQRWPDNSVEIASAQQQNRFRSFVLGDRRHVHGDGIERSFEIVDERTRWLGSNAAAKASAGERVLSSMPGRVVSIAVDVGDEVEAGDVIIVLEAMKMENDVKTRSAGRVTEIAVQTGDAVEARVLLARIEPLS